MAASELGVPASGKSERLHKVNDDGFGLICRRDEELRLLREAVGQTELHHMVGIDGAGWLRKYRQCACHGAVMMPGAVPFVMQ